MPEARTNLELFILALLTRGLSTPYDLQTRAGISVGAAIPALKRLEKGTLVEGTPGSRRSRRFDLTASGRRLLQSELKELADEIPSDFESILRVAYLLWVTESQRTVRTFLKRAAKERLQLARHAKAESTDLLSADLPLHEGHGHRWMKAFTSAVRLRAEAVALNRLSSKLPKSPL